MMLPPAITAFRTVKNSRISARKAEQNLVYEIIPFVAWYVTLRDRVISAVRPNAP